MSCGDQFTLMSKKLAELACSLIAIDDDGIPIIDYLGAGFKQQTPSNFNPVLVEKAYEFILRESEKHRNGKNSTLAFRYTLLRDYFEHRMHIWQD